MATRSYRRRMCCGAQRKRHMDLTDTGWVRCQLELEATTRRTLHSWGPQTRYDVADIVQDGLIQIWQTDSLEDDNISPGLLRCIARGHTHKTIRQHRSAKRDARRDRQLADTEAGRFAAPDAECLTREIVVVVNQAIEQLEPVSRYIVRRHSIDGWALASVAESLGRSQQACRRLLRKSMQHLRAIIIEAIGRLTGELRQDGH